MVPDLRLMLMRMGLGMVQVSSVLASRRSEAMKIMNFPTLWPRETFRIDVSVFYSLLNVGFFFCIPLSMASLTSCVWSMPMFQTAVYFSPSSMV
jgi:hypothetical protein